MAENIQTIKFLGCSVVSFSSNIGFNGNPSTLSVTMAEDFANGDNFAADSHTINDELAATYGGTAFSDGNPGTLAKFKTPDDKFIFTGFVTNYRRSKGISGNLVNVELSDPRFLFANIPLINDANLNINTTSFSAGTWNILCAPAIFNNPIVLDWNGTGVRFDKLAKAIESKTFNFYGKAFKILFHVSFYSQLVGGYRLRQQLSSVEDAINQAAKEANVDWFLEMGESAGLNIAYIKGLKRKNQYSFATQDNGLKSFINTRIDKVASWEIGRELRQDPTVAIVYGDKVRTLWNTNPGGAFAIYSELGNGMVIDRAFVPLDFLRSYGYTSLPTVSIKVSETETTVNINTNDEFGNTRARYPSRSKSQANRARSGYIATEAVLRAALFSKDAWQTAVWYEYCNGISAASTIPILFNQYNSFDLGFGFGAPSAQSVASFLMNPNSVGVFGPAFDFDLGQSTNVISAATSALNETLKEAVYQATLKCAQEYYGKKFICRLPSSQICNDIGASYEHNQKKIPIEYDVVDASPPVAFYDSTSFITLPQSLLLSDGKSFRNPNGLFRPFMFLDHASLDGAHNQVQYEYIDPSSSVWAAANTGEQVGNATLYHSGVSVETYRFDPRFAIVTLNEPVLLGVQTHTRVNVTARTNGAITGWSVTTPYTPISKTDRSGCFLEFLSRVYSGFSIVLATDSDLNSAGVRVNVNRSALKVSVDHYYSLQTQAIALQSVCGLAEIRMTNLNAYGGFFIPLVWNYIRYGPWVNGNSNTRPVNVIEDTRLNPWSYGSYGRMDDAGNIIAERSNTLTHTIAYASVSVEGYPEFGLGSELASGTDAMGAISDISMTFGLEGVKTTYKFKSFFGPVGFTKRSELDLISQNSFSSSSNRSAINVNSIFESVQEQIYNATGGGASTQSVGSTLGSIGIGTFSGSINTKNANPPLTGKPVAHSKSTNESNTSNYGDTVDAQISSLFTPVTTRSPSTVRGQVPTIEGGLLS